MKFDQYLNEAKGRILFHGISDRNVAETIIKNGFSLRYVKPRYKEDYAVSAAKTKKNVIGWMGQKATILKFSYTGKIQKAPQISIMVISKMTPQEYTNKMLELGIDAVDKGGAIFIYNLDKITNIKIIE